MWTRIAVAGVAVSLLAGGVARAEELQVSPDEGSDLSAVGGWLTWTRWDGGTRFLWHAGTVTALPDLGPRVELGSDARGRPEAVYVRCGEVRCEVRARRLRDGAERRLLLTRRRVGHAVERRGTLAYASSGATNSPNPRAAAVWLRGRGGQRTRRVVARNVSWIDLAAGRLIYWSDDPHGDVAQITVVDLAGRKPHTRVLAVDDEFDEDCRCGQQRRETDPHIAGRFAYWLDTTLAGPDGVDGDTVTRVLRVDLTMADPAVEALRPEHVVNQYAALAVEGGAVSYASWTDALGVYRIARPKWEPTGESLPVRG
jgi:hypothetical protein